MTVGTTNTGGNKLTGSATTTGGTSRWAERMRAGNNCYRRYFGNRRDHDPHGRDDQLGRDHQHGRNDQRGRDHDPHGRDHQRGRDHQHDARMGNARDWRSLGHGDRGHGDGEPQHHRRDDRCRFRRVQLRKDAHHEWLVHQQQHEHDCALQAPWYSDDAAWSQRCRALHLGWHRDGTFAAKWAAIHDKDHDRRSRPTLRLSGRDRNQDYLWRQFPVLAT